jgi:hypothetical protein
VKSIGKHLEKKPVKMPENFITSTVHPGLALEDHSYGKGGIKVLHLVRNGEEVLFFVPEIFSVFCQTSKIFVFKLLS